MRSAYPPSRRPDATFAAANPPPTTMHPYRLDMACLLVSLDVGLGAERGEELRARSGVVAQNAEHCRRTRERSLRGDAAQGHTGVLGLDDDADSLGRQRVREMRGDLLRQPLLHLRPPREMVDDPRELREPEDRVGRYVRDVRDADERQQ